MQEAQIVIGIVEYDFDIFVLQQRAEFRRRADRQRVDDRVAVDSCKR